MNFIDVAYKIYFEKRIQGFKGLFSNALFNAFSILSISAMFRYAVANSTFSIMPQSPANKSGGSVCAPSKKGHLTFSTPSAL